MILKDQKYVYTSDMYRLNNNGPKQNPWEHHAFLEQKISTLQQRIIVYFVDRRILIYTSDGDIISCLFLYKSLWFATSNAFT